MNRLCLILLINIASTSILYGVNLRTFDLKVGVIKIGEPMGYVDEATKNPTGVYWEISKAICERTGLRYDLMLLPYKRMLKFLEQGKIDFAIFFTNPERKKKFHQVGLVQNRPVGIVSRQGVHIKTFGDLAGFNIGYISGGKYNKSFDEATHFHKTSVKDYRIGINLLGAKRIDGMIGSLVNIYAASNEAVIAVSDPYIMKNNQAWLQYSRNSKNPKHMEVVGRALRELYAKDAFVGIHEHFISVLLWRALHHRRDVNHHSCYTFL